MPRVQVTVDLSDDALATYEEEAHRLRIKVETMIGRDVSRMLREAQAEQDAAGPDFIVPS